MIRRNFDHFCHFDLHANRAAVGAVLIGTTYAKTEEHRRDKTTTTVTSIP